MEISPKHWPKGFVPKDSVWENTHPKNRRYVGPKNVQYSNCGVAVNRPPLFEIYMRTAEQLSKRSTCSRLQVGTVITDMSLEAILAVGYNGNARGFPNECDREQPGNCGCIHSEKNALVKAPGKSEKTVFITDSPCEGCAKLLVQANTKYVFYRRKYRNTAGLDVLSRAEIPSIHYTKWAETEW